ncbi:hypothetical protein F4820DRAFT_447971 [Hypoxylon rubiginosum]|uniref:Uncharacterized protein n=1 Tax=Hypoxylon rubiginosum TaxID=110542 RepID=A0ACB9Z157_9PEZI|nr:hypothetical protein F4820DRAFT_447971 [Hypoxylon rubiginosum]
MADEPSVAQVQQQAEPMIKRIWDNYSALRDTVTRYESVIQRRWIKKNKPKRQTVLESAWGSSPPIATVHRPDVAYMRYRLRRGITDASDPQKRSYFMWPDISLEDLCNTEPLLLMLNARGRSPPSTFAFADIRSTGFGFRCGIIEELKELKGWNMRFADQDTSTSYAKLVPWKDDHRPGLRVQLCQDFNPMEGLWILEIQDRVYQFLLGTCRLILHDLPTDTKHLQTLAAEPEPPLPTVLFKGDAAATSLMISRYEATYHLPAEFDVRRLRDLTEAKVAESEDTLLALCEDPGAFAYKALERYEHRPEHLLDAGGKRHIGIATPENRDNLMVVTIACMLRHHIVAVETWGMLLDKVNHFVAAKEEYLGRDYLDYNTVAVLLPDLELSYLSLMMHLRMALKSDLRMVKTSVHVSPPFRHLSRCEPSGNLVEIFEDVQIEYLDSKKMTDAEFSLVWVLRGVAKIDQMEMVASICVDEFERLARDPQDRKLITSFLAEQFSSISIKAEMNRHLVLFQPYSAIFTTAITTDAVLCSKVAQEYIQSSIFMDRLLSFELPETAKKIGAALVKMKYPVDKRPSKSNTETMRAAEATLATFWEEVFAQLRRDDLLRSRLGAIYTKRKPEQTPEWIEPLKKENRGSSDANIPEARGDTYTGQLEEKMEKFTLTNPKVKPKTRPSKPTAVGGGVANRDANADPPERAGRDLQPPFQVNSRAKKVFAMLFHEHGSSQLPGEIPWTEFLYAMHHIGFGVEKLGGSSWLFKPGPTIMDRLPAAQPIQIHDPHPRSKVRFWEARRHGRRLETRYGFKADTFREE